MGLIIHKIRTLCKHSVVPMLASLHQSMQTIGGGKELIIQDVARVCIVCAVGILGYGLGSLTAHSNASHTLRVDATHRVPYIAVLPSSQSQAAMHATGESSQGKQIVVSKKGKKYHYVWCTGAQSISPKNRRYFATTKDARDAGYTPASNCPGLH
jgi:hypothetical protein